jgi:hypothetical protein
MSGRARTSVQAGSIGQVTVHPPPTPLWRILLVVAVAVLLLGAVVAVWLDETGGRSAQSNSTEPGIPRTSEIVESTTGATSGRIPLTTTVESPEDKVDGPVLSGEFTLGVSQSHDLDQDRSAFPSAGADLGLSGEALYAPATGELRLPKGGHAADCLDQPARQQVAVDRLPTTVCVVTDQGALATVHPKLVSGPLERSPRVSVTFELWTVPR